MTSHELRCVNKAGGYSIDRLYKQLRPQEGYAIDTVQLEYGKKISASELSGKTAQLRGINAHMNTLAELLSSPLSRTFPAHQFHYDVSTVN